MSWDYKDPNHFPAIYVRGIIQAAASPNQPYLFYHASSHSDAVGKAAQFRHFKWCCRQPPLVLPVIFDLLTQFKFRTRIEASPHLYQNPYVIWLTAQPDLLQSMLDLNPHLSDIFATECQ